MELSLDGDNNRIELVSKSKSSNGPLDSQFSMMPLKKKAHRKGANKFYFRQLKVYKKDDLDKYLMSLITEYYNLV